MMRLEDPLVIPGRLCAPKTKGEYNGVLGLVWFRAVCPLNGQMRNACFHVHAQYVAFTAWLELWPVSVYLSKAGIRFRCLFV
jgi:hypothetical protein